MIDTKHHRQLPRCATIAPQDPFLGTLVEALFDGRLVSSFTCTCERLEEDPFTLTDVTLFLPTRRAVRAASSIFLQAISELYNEQTSAAFLPKIHALGDVEEADLLLQENSSIPFELLAKLPSALSELERHIALTKMVWTWSQTLLRQTIGLSSEETVIIPANPGDAAWLAKDLARLLDEAKNVGIDWNDLTKLVPDDFSRYWQISLSFLEIITKHWPRYLAESRCIDGITRRNLLIRAQIAALKDRTSTAAPVIAAGSTGSVPITAELLKTVAHMPQGCVVLPGIDLELDDKVWSKIGYGPENSSLNDIKTYGHPQFILKQTLSHIGLARSEVVLLSTKQKTERHTQAGRARQRLINEALRPSECTDTWPQVIASLGQNTLQLALENAGLLEADSSQEEALSIALILRHALEQKPSCKHLSPYVVVITPDRNLARRITVELNRFGIEIDDSAGAPLFATPSGALAKLCLEAAENGAASIPLLGLMKHPLAGFGVSRGTIRHDARTLERAILRGPAVNVGMKQIAQAVQQLYSDLQNNKLKSSSLNSAQRGLNASQWQSAIVMAERLQRALAPLENLFSEPKVLHPLPVLAKAHMQVIEAIVAGPDTMPQFTSSEDGPALFQALHNLSNIDPSLRIRAVDYGKILQCLIGERIIRKQAKPDPRVHILGTLEARLLHVDTVILAGLNEKEWPAETRLDPWLSRAMRAKLGLASPEYNLGLSAHDFAQYSAKAQVFFTRTVRKNGAPTQASRWLQRLKALIGKPGCNMLFKYSEPYLNLARCLEAPKKPAGQPVKRPAPRPSKNVRPQKLSVTEIETLIRDPYAIYAKHVLGLSAFTPIAEVPDLATRGSLVHAILHEFFSKKSGAFDTIEAQQTLMAIAEQHIKKLEMFPDIYAHWQTRFRHMADWVLQHEAMQSSHIESRLTERRGVLEFKNLPFRLTARADRIDVLKNGQGELIDYKTGAPPTKKQIETHLAPQLTLEAAILIAGGFENTSPLRCEKLSYIQLSGNQPPGEYKPIASGVENVEALAVNVVEKLQNLITYYSQEETGYLSQAQPQSIRHEGDYDHLARVDEWRGLDGSFGE